MEKTIGIVANSWQSNSNESNGLPSSWFPIVFSMETRTFLRVSDRMSTKKANKIKATIKPRQASDIRIACDVKDFVELDQLKDLQGDLKSLSEPDQRRLRNEILTSGFAFPVYVWKSGKDAWIIGGHQRVKVLRILREENYRIPKVPVVYVHAKDVVEAKRRVIQDVAQYGKIEQGGLFEFISAADIDIANLVSSFKLPDVDLKAFQSAFFPEAKHVEFDVKKGSGGKELQESDFQSFDHECPKCGFGFDEK